MPWLFALSLLLAVCCAGAFAQQSTGAQQPSAQGAAGATAPSVSQPGSADASAAENTPEAEAPEKGSGAGFVFKTEVQEVVLHATVVDEHHQPVTGLTRNDFQVFEDGKPQQITSFRWEDVPVAMAIVIDNSGSMRDKRTAVNAAALNLVRSSNHDDQVCVVNFNNESYLDQDYTGDINLLQQALQHIESRGGTALYDALVATSEHLMKTAKLQKRVILVVTDGEDTASHDSLEEAVRAVAIDGGPVVYTIGILGHEKEKKARRALRILADQTGGVAYFPSDVSQVQAISQQIAQEIRTQYSIAYEPTTPMSEGGYRRVLVKAHAPGHKGLLVRTRAGYYANEHQTASVSQ